MAATAALALMTVQPGEVTAVSGLLGLIWEARDDLAFDLGFRVERDDGSDVRELRAG